MSSLLALLLVTSIDGNAALRHASALAALGPHPWGSTRNEAAALYVAAQMRAAGLPQVELQRFERDGVPGTNVVGTLPGPGEEFLVVAAHHDSAPGAPGAYDDGGGVGVLLEIARTLVAERARARAIVFASFDGEEAWARGGGTTAGSRAYLERLGTRSRALVAAVVIEMCGWRGGTPVLHPIAYPDPRAAGRQVLAPAWLVRAALAGSRADGSPFAVGDPYLSWLYQPAVRSFRVRFYGDDISFLQSGRPALFASDSSFSAFYPDYHRSSDVALRLDAGALARMGAAALGAVRELERLPRGPDAEPQWFAAFGRAVDWPWLLGLGVLSTLPGLRAAYGAGVPALGLRLLQSAGFGVLLWLDPVPALWTFLAPNLVLPFARRRWTVAVCCLPLAALVAIGIAAAWRGAVSGLWLGPWQLSLAAVAFALTFFGLGPSRRGGGRSRRRRPSAAAARPATSRTR